MLFVPIFLTYLGLAVVVVGIIGIIHDVVVDWITIKSLEIVATPSVLSSNANQFKIELRMRLKDDSWFFGNILGPRRTMSWRIVVEPDANAVSGGWVQPANFVKQGGRTTFAYIHEDFIQQWDPPLGEHGTTLRVYIQNQEIVNQRFKFIRIQ